MKTLNPTQPPISISSTHADALQLLKQKYLSCLGSISRSAVTLREVVNELIDGREVSRRELVAWAVEAGYSEKTIRALLSKLLCSKGRRKRKAGAGRKVSPAVLELAELVCSEYGARKAAKLLRAAAGVAGRIAEAIADIEQSSRGAIAPSSAAVPDLGNSSQAEMPVLIVVNNNDTLAAVN